MKTVRLCLVTCALLFGWSAHAGKGKPPPTTLEGLADRALAAMEKRASELGIQGVAVIAFSEGDVVKSWSSKMRVIGVMRKDPVGKEPGANLLGIAYTKAAEMADTLKDSGQAGRPKLTGETGWPGGVIKKVKRGYIIGAFSGGPSQDDVKVSQAGIDVLNQQM